MESSDRTKPKAPRTKSLSLPLGQPTSCFSFAHFDLLNERFSHSFHPRTSSANDASIRTSAPLLCSAHRLSFHINIRTLKSLSQSTILRSLVSLFQGVGPFLLRLFGG